MVRVFSLFTALLLVDALAAETVLVTGSNRGIGLEFVTHYAERGWTVIATSRSPQDDTELLALAEKRDNVKVEELDVTRLDQISALADKYEGTAIDLLINNAGLSGDRSRQAWGSLAVGQFDELMAVNVFGPLKISEAFAAHVAASDQGKIVAISSTAGSIASLNRATPLPLLAVSKTALNMAMRTVAMRLKEQGVTVVVLMPGAVDTRALRQAFGLSLEEAAAAVDFDYGNYPTMTTEQSVSQLVQVIDGLELEMTGTFLNYDGSEIPW